MNTVQSPRVSEFESDEKEASYTAWLKQKIDRARTSSKPLVPHDQVMAQAREVIVAKRKKHAAG
jgi:hypothetical protein